MRQHDVEESFQDTKPLSTENVVQLRDRVAVYDAAAAARSIPAYLGLDIGSVSTNVVVIDEFGTVIHDVYLRTAGRPIEAVQQGLAEVERSWGSRMKICGVGTTGSGRELIAEFVGADVVNDEITAHKTGAIHISSTLGGEPVDTIFEIGGQDSKFISIENGVVVDFAMNEACAAGTGSFLEEQAEKLGISIKGEFARLALSAQSPTRLGERCTVFMERDVTGWMHKGESVPHLVAGLAYSIALNYLNRVVRGRKIGKVIYFQGGTAYNDAVTAAFASLLGKKITVPPYNGVMGAIGMALIARQWHAATQGASRFRGYDLHKLELTTRDFVCKACSNLCDMKEFVIEGQKSFWGDKCSDKFRKPSSTGRKPVIDDLFAYREALLEALPAAAGGQIQDRPAARDVDAGPAAFLEALFRGTGHGDGPLAGDRSADFGWRDRTLGGRAVLSGAGGARACAGADDRGRGLRVAAGDGGRGGGRGWLRVALLPLEPDAAVGIEIRAGAGGARTEFLTPTLHFRLGAEQIKKALAETMRRVGVTRRASDRAVDAAYTEQRGFQERLIEAGRKALAALEKSGEPGIVLAGRGYNMYDRGVNCDIPRKLRHRYGANVIPLDFLVTGNEPLSELHANMFWISGRKILEAARIASERPNLHMIYLTNFKCGPDSYIKHFAREAAGAPLLILQFDGHGNDAGLHDALRSVPRQQRNSAMLPIYDGAAAGADHRDSTPKHSGDHPLKGKRIYIPPMAYGSARAFASAFRAIGLEAEPTPPSDHRTRELGARYTSGDECYPAKVTVGDFMKVVENPGR